MLKPIISKNALYLAENAPKSRIDNVFTFKSYFSVKFFKAIHREQQMIILLEKNTSCKPVQNVQTKKNTQISLFFYNPTDNKIHLHL